jgi:hypothetical protein
VDEARVALGQLTDWATFRDPEGWYYWAQAAALVGDHENALEMLRRAVSTGFSCPRALESTPMFDALRGSAALANLVGIAQGAHEAAVAAFAKADGYRLLGLPQA